MRYALINPPWSFAGSVYFGCRDPHLPLELGYARALLEAAGHDVLLLDAALCGHTYPELRAHLARFAPDFTVIPTAPSYLFWRCPPPELRVPQEAFGSLREVAGATVVVGPHASTTPRATLRKLGVDVAVMGECEEVLPRLADTDWAHIDGIARWEGAEPIVQGGPQSADMQRLPSLRWEAGLLQRHAHHHHRFDRPPEGPGAELEASRGCPYACSFCAKDNFRDRYRRRPLTAVLEELDGLLAQGVRYVYFVDEIFLPWRELLEALAARDLRFGVQTRIDLWKPGLLDLLGAAGCVSIEAGVESISDEGRTLLNKDCRISTAELTARLVHAKRSVPFVQASLLDSKADDPAQIEAWRRALLDAGVWANKPVPMFPYPGSPGYLQRWGLPDDLAWERAHAHYLQAYTQFSDIQEQRPLPLAELEAARNA
jgi:anaerobic magnesium-protoporphyrin IX monomethyl ester cyclase